MVSAVLLAALCLLLCGSAAADVRHRGPCPYINPNTTTENFQPEKFYGQWHVLRSFGPDGSCVSLNYTSCGAGCLRVHERSQVDAISRIGLPNVYQRDGELRPTGGSAAHMEATFAGGVILSPVQYVVLETDYDSFALVYTCREVGLASFTLYHLRDVLLLNRERNGTVTPEQVEEISEVLIANQLEEEFESVSHEGCISSDQAVLDFDPGRLVQRVNEVANSIASRVGSFFSGALSAILP